jgi:hypothetical protein
MEVPDTCGRADMTKVKGAFRDYADVLTDKDADGKARGLLQYC